MKKLFKIGLVVCPLLNCALLLLLSGKSPEKAPAPPAITFIESADFSNNNFTAPRFYSAPRSYLIKFDDCFEQ